MNPRTIVPEAARRRYNAAPVLCMAFVRVDAGGRVELLRPALSEREWQAGSDEARRLLAALRQMPLRRCVASREVRR
jgi:ligand-binding sensor domain-containing protein